MVKYEDQVIILENYKKIIFDNYPFVNKPIVLIKILYVHLKYLSAIFSLPYYLYINDINKLNNVFIGSLDNKAYKI